MKNYKYAWSRHFSVPAQTFGELYYNLPKRSPDELVRAARNSRSPIHELFNWDDKSAAHEQRLIQARVMISSLQVEIISAKGKPSRVIAFIGSSDRGRHVATMEASPEELTEEKQSCWRDMVRFRSRYRHIEMVESVIDAINEVDRRLRRRKAA